MNEFVIGSLTVGVVGVIGLAISSRPKPSRKLHALTEHTETLLKIIGNLKKPSPPDLFSPQLSFSDVLSVYLNSRDRRSFMNEQRLERRDKGSSKLLEKLDANHSHIKRLVLAWVGVLILAKLAPDCHTSYCRNLLWSYAEGQELLSQLGEYCSGRDQDFILTRV